MQYVTFYPSSLITLYCENEDANMSIYLGKSFFLLDFATEPSKFHIFDSGL